MLSWVQSLSHVRLFATPWTAARQGLLFLTNSWSLDKLMSIESVMPSNHLILCHPFLLLPSIFPSNRVFSNESVLHVRWAKYWRFNFSIGLSNEYSGLISFRIDWFNFLALEWTLKSIVQHHSSKPLILQNSGFFVVHPSHLYIQLHSVGFLRPHGLQHTRLPCPSPTPRAYSNSCPSSPWCHPIISSSVVPFFSHL